MPDAGVGDHDIEAAIALADIGEDLDPALLAGDILRQEDHLATSLLEPRGELGSPQLVDVGRNNRRAFLREQFDDRLADTRRAAGHQRDLAFNLSCHVHSQRFLFDHRRALIRYRDVEHTELHTFGALPTVDCKRARHVQLLAAILRQGAAELLSDRAECDTVDDGTVAGLEAQPQMRLPDLVGID